MAIWLTTTKALLERVAKRDLLQDELNRIDGELCEIAPALEAFSDEIELPRIEGPGSALLASRVDRKLEEIAVDWDAARDLETSLRDAESRIEKLQSKEKEARSASEAWNVKWQTTLVALGVKGLAVDWGFETNLLCTGPPISGILSLSEDWRTLPICGVDWGRVKSEASSALRARRGMGKKTIVGPNPLQTARMTATSV